MARSTGSWVRGLFRVVAALLVCVLVGGAGGYFALHQQPRYRATMHVVIVPGDEATLQESAMLFDSLSRGQVVATAANVISYAGYLDLPDETVTVTAGEVTPSAVVAVSVTADDPQTATRYVAEVVSASKQSVDASIQPYIMLPVPARDPHVEPVGLSRDQLLALAGLGAVIAAILVWGAIGLVAPRSQVRSPGSDGARGDAEQVIPDPADAPAATR